MATQFQTPVTTHFSIPLLSGWNALGVPWRSSSCNPMFLSRLVGAPSCPAPFALYSLCAFIFMEQIYPPFLGGWNMTCNGPMVFKQPWAPWRWCLLMTYQPKSQADINHLMDLNRAIIQVEAPELDRYGTMIYKCTPSFYFALLFAPTFLGVLERSGLE